MRVRLERFPGLGQLEDLFEHVGPDHDVGLPGAKARRNVLDLWSTTIIMKVDLVGPARRGLAMGLNEFAGYVAAGFVLSLLARETLDHVAVESRSVPPASVHARGVFWRTTFGDRNLSSVCQAGFVNNLAAFRRLGDCAG